MILIGISGKKKHGKNQAADFLDKNLFAHLVGQFAFADELKAEIAEHFGVPVSTIEAHKDDFRLILQGWGMARRKFYGEYYWINKLAKSLFESCADIAIITDVRLQNEYQFVKDRGGIMVRVENNRIQSYDTHISETALDNHQFDCVIPNHGTLEDLEREVAKFAKTTIQPLLRK